MNGLNHVYLHFQHLSIIIIIQSDLQKFFLGIAVYVRLAGRSCKC